MLVLAIGKNSR